MTRALRIAIVAAFRHPVTQPAAGGLEMHVYDLVRTLRERGHEVVLAAPEGSDHLDASRPELIYPRVVWAREEDRTDAVLPPGFSEVQERVLAHVMRALDADERGFDVIHNHSLAAAPVAASRGSRSHVVTTLHTPPLPDILAGVDRMDEDRHRFLTVSDHTAAAWAAHGVGASVLRPGVDTHLWRPGPGPRDHPWVWFGRIVPEKAPHLAIDAARAAGRPLVLAGRVGHPNYYEREIAPRLGDGVLHLGALGRAELSQLVASAPVALVTPEWDEPFGLVVPEALACGTPVAAFARGGLVEAIAGVEAVRLVPGGDVDALARAALDLSERPRLRTLARTVACSRFSLESVTDELEFLYRRLGRERRRAASSSHAERRADTAERAR